MRPSSIRIKAVDFSPSQKKNARFFLKKDKAIFEGFNFCAPVCKSITLVIWCAQEKHWNAYNFYISGNGCNFINDTPATEITTLFLVKRPRKPISKKEQAHKLAIGAQNFELAN